MILFLLSLSLTPNKSEAINFLQQAVRMLPSEKWNEIVLKRSGNRIARLMAEEMRSSRKANPSVSRLLS